MMKSTDISRPVNLPRAFRRDKILQAGLEFVREHGFLAITCEAIAAAAGCSYNTVRRHFSNRRKLAVAITEYAGKMGERQLAQQGKRITAAI